ncbi:MAG: hypothetical protein DRP08_00260 [Candidatus Aenigmatarchaeota archaeon]|nr:MAG: hypothetical protein DRP08_00260 [Candidatus Aenigmarchaeota archaeon]
MIFCIPCLVLVLYFLVASVFFPKYRIYVKDGWTCFIDKLKGKDCSLSFDNKMRLALSVWFAEKNMPAIGRFIGNKRNFTTVMMFVGVILTIVSVFLFILMIKFLRNPPCDTGVCGL